MNWMNWTLVVFGIWNIFDGIWSLWYKESEHTIAADAGRVVRALVGVGIISLAILMG